MSKQISCTLFIANLCVLHLKIIYSSHPPPSSRVECEQSFFCENQWGRGKTSKCPSVTWSVTCKRRYSTCFPTPAPDACTTCSSHITLTLQRFRVWHSSPLIFEVKRDRLLQSISHVSDPVRA